MRAPVMQAFFSFLRSTSILDDGYCSPMTDAVPPIVETDEDVRQEIIDTVRRFVAKDVLPVASDLEHADEFPAAIVEKMRELGLFGVTIPRSDEHTSALQSLIRLPT